MTLHPPYITNIDPSSYTPSLVMMKAWFLVCITVLLIALFLCALCCAFDYVIKRWRGGKSLFATPTVLPLAFHSTSRRFLDPPLERVLLQRPPAAALNTRWSLLPHPIGCPHCPPLSYGHYLRSLGTTNIPSVYSMASSSHAHTHSEQIMSGTF